MPQDGPPPRYSSVVKRVYPYSLRPILGFTSLLGLIWAVAWGVSQLRNISTPNQTSQVNIWNIVLGVIYLVIGVIELFGLLVSIWPTLAFGRILNLAAPTGVILAAVVQTIGVVLHFSLKNDLINTCTANLVGSIYYDQFGNTQTVNSSQASSSCNNAWSQGTWSVFAWLVVTLIIAFMFGAIAMGYYRQLRDPSLVRNYRQTQQGIPLQQSGYYPPPPQQYEWTVPPYPGPPNQPFEKSDYHPQVPWAQNSYAGGSHNRPEEEAWARAQTEGVTAHLTGHNNPNTSPGGPARGYQVTNDEEGDDDKVRMSK